MSDTTKPTICAADVLKYAVARRRELAAKRLCINGENHGPATQGCRCDWCAAVHKKGLRNVLADPSAPPRPPGHKVPEIYKPVDIAAVPPSAGGNVSGIGYDKESMTFSSGANLLRY